MILTWLLLKLKLALLSIVNAFRRALCCFRPRTQNYDDSAPLTHVVSHMDSQQTDVKWSEWGNDGFKSDKPKTVQDYIEQYREQSMKVTESPDVPQEHTFFDDMAPEIVRQTKVLIKTNDKKPGEYHNRLGVIGTGALNVVTSNELEEWEENSGWGGEHLLDDEAQQVLKEQKRLERERKAWEQHQKRLEKPNRTLGSRLTT